MRISRRVLACIAMAIFSTIAAQADTFTESVQFGPGPTDFNRSTGTTAGPSGTTLYYFDTQGGTLNSISFRYSYSISSQITLTNTSQTSSTGTARTQSAAQFSSDSSAVTAALNRAVNTYVDPVDGTAVTFGRNTLTPIAADVRGTATNYSLSPGGTTSFSSTGGYSSNLFTDTSAADLAAFSQSGGGTFTPLFTTLTGLIISNAGGNTTATQITTGQGNLVISYNYTPNTVVPVPVAATPEPSSLLLLGTGLLGIVGAARKRLA